MPLALLRVACQSPVTRTLSRSLRLLTLAAHGSDREE